MNYLKKYNVESNSISLFDFQQEKLNEMIAIDSYFETKEICGRKFNFKAGTGLHNNIDIVPKFENVKMDDNSIAVKIHFI